MTWGNVFLEKRKCKEEHCSPMSNSAWCGLNNKCDTPNLHDICHNPRCKCQKQFTFTPRQFQLEGARFESKSIKRFERTEKM